MATKKDLFLVDRSTGEESFVAVLDNNVKQLSKIILRFKKRRKLKRQWFASEEHNLDAVQNISDDFDLLLKPHESGNLEDESARKKTKCLQLNPDGTLQFSKWKPEHFNKNEKAKRVVQNWLLNPTVINGSLQSLHVKVTDMKALDSDLTKRLTENGIEYFYPVQAEIIPWLLNSSKDSKLTVPQDVCVLAPKGSGKTLTYVLPIIQLLKDHSRRHLRVLVVVPTSSIGRQIFQVFKESRAYAELGIGIISVNLIYDTDMEFDDLLRDRMSTSDILICTPAKLIDQLDLADGFHLGNLEYLIIDDADQVLESVEEGWFHTLGDRINKDRYKMGWRASVGPRKLIFTSKLSQDPKTLKRLHLFQPKLFTCVVEDNTTVVVEPQSNIIDISTTPDSQSECCILCSPLAKPRALYKFLKDKSLTRVLIFTHSIESVHRLKLMLEYMFKNELNVEEISSQTLNVRKTLIDSFMSNAIDVLVCPDAMAKHIDLLRVHYVISYSTGKAMKTYIHREGGPRMFITFVQPEHKSAFLNMLEKAEKHNIEWIEYTKDELEENNELFNMAQNHLNNSVANEINM